MTCIAPYDLIRALHPPAAVRVLYQRAACYRNVFYPASHFFRPRGSDGKWTPHFWTTSRSEAGGATSAVERFTLRPTSQAPRS